jgi:hypothetical protein
MASSLLRAKNLSDLITVVVNHTIYYSMCPTEAKDSFMRKAEAPNHPTQRRFRTGGAGEFAVEEH